MKYIIVTGGVVSGLGKGITISSIGRILSSSGIKVTSIKIDPYMNVDAGTMSPFEHGETFVLDDGGETDLDLGNYERFLDITLTSNHNITSGKIYQEIVTKERRGDYLGKTVQIIPHGSDLVMDLLDKVSTISVDGSGEIPDVCLVEVGGTVGDIESMLFLEAIRQFQYKVGRDNVMFIHVSLVPTLGTIDEQKTKPTQHTVKELRSLGINPDMIVVRCGNKVLESTKSKIGAFCHIDASNVISVHNVSNIYHIPMMLVEQGVHTSIKRFFKLNYMYDEPEFGIWKEIAVNTDNVAKTPERTVNIAIVGKYTGLTDTYLSVINALNHAGIHNDRNINIVWIDATELENKSGNNESFEKLRRVDGVVVPGGFGNRGVEGKIIAANYCRANNKPFLGVCLGMQVMVIEYARNVMGITDATSEEFVEESIEKTNNVIIFMPEGSKGEMGGTMRLGSRETQIKKGSFASKIYKNKLSVQERHRHRYEVSPDYIEKIEEQGLIFSGRDVSGKRMEIVELDEQQHSFYFGTQFHPEFKSKPHNPSPPFYKFIEATIKQRF